MFPKLWKWSRAPFCACCLLVTKLLDTRRSLHAVLARLPILEYHDLTLSRFSRFVWEAAHRRSAQQWPVVAKWPKSSMLSLQQCGKLSWIIFVYLPFEVTSILLLNILNFVAPRLAFEMFKRQTEKNQDKFPHDKNMTDTWKDTKDVNFIFSLTRAKVKGVQKNPLNF